MAVTLDLDGKARHQLARALAEARSRDPHLWSECLLDLEILMVTRGQISSDQVTAIVVDPDAMDDRPVKPLTYQEAADQLGCSRSTVYRMVRSGELDTVTVGARRRIPASEIRGRTSP